MFAATAVGAGAAVRYRFKSDADFRRNTEELAGRAVNGIVKGISDSLPNPELPDISEYKSENFYSGHSEFRDSGKRGARWRLGYARRSLVPEDYLSHDYYIAGYLSYPPNVMSEVLDDQDKELTAVGLCNDSVGYILPDNDYGSIVAKNHYEEAVSAGGKAGSTLVKAFSKLLEDCGRLGR